MYHTTSGTLRRLCSTLKTLTPQEAAMFKNVLIVAALVIASPGIVFGQDFFWSFDSTSLQTSATEVANTSGTAYIFVDGLVGFDAVDLNFTSSNASVLLLTDGETTNPEFGDLGSTRFNSSEITIDGAGDAGNLFAVNITENGVNPMLAPLFDPDFDANVGPNGATLLASVDYSVVGPGTATLEFNLGPQGVVVLPGLFIPTFGSATLTASAAAVPEPSSAALLVLGAVGFIARRRRASS